MQNAPRDERRLHGRAEIEATVICKGGRGQAILAFDGGNVSIGGILVRSAVEVRAGQDVALEFSLPVGFVPLGPSTLEVHGKVVRAMRVSEGEKQYDLAVRFIDLNEEQEEVLAKYVRRKNLLGRR